MITHHLPLKEEILATPEQPDDDPGSRLPADFPRSEFSDEQLVALEEYYLTKQQVLLERFYSILRVHPKTLECTYNTVLKNCAILAKLLGLTEGMSWQDIAKNLGTHPSTVSQHARAIIEHIRHIND